MKHFLTGQQSGLPERIPGRIIQVISVEGAQLNPVVSFQLLIQANLLAQ
jgi:hypothetical protein